jgi:hypothetical protein
MERLVAEGAPAMTWGMATYPDDDATAEELLAAADRRLLERRRGRPRPERMPSGADLGFQP